MIIVDYSQVLLASVFVFSDEFKKGKDPEAMKGILRHTLLSSLLVYKREYGKKYGEIVIACDGREYWRKKYFSLYKANRKKNREESELDWDSIFTHLASMRQELIDYFPWKVILLQEAEGDDIMAVLSKYCVENHTTQDGLFEDVEPVMLISSDGDMRQCHNKHVRQWSPIQKKFVSPPEKDFLVAKIIRGDSGDGICNIRSKNDCFVTGSRQLPISKKFMQETMESNLSNLTPFEKNRFEENKTLIDFDMIPTQLKQKIIDEYLNQDKSDFRLNSVYEFLLSVKSHQLLQRIQEFK